MQVPKYQASGDISRFNREHAVFRFQPNSTSLSASSSGKLHRMKPTQSPFLTRFLSDFTLGFSDGLTVPFALTAGLSSLGRTDTVISGGLAELCAGSISMGIGGYLAARDEIPKHSQLEESQDEEELRGML